MPTSPGCRFPTDTFEFFEIQVLYECAGVLGDEDMAEAARARLREYAAPYLRAALPHANARGRHGPRPGKFARPRHKVQEER